MAIKRDLLTAPSPWRLPTVSEYQQTGHGLEAVASGQLGALINIDLYDPRCELSAATSSSVGASLLQGPHQLAEQRTAIGFRLAVREFIVRSVSFVGDARFYHEDARLRLAVTAAIP